jgi:hypothetical protein
MEKWKNYQKTMWGRALRETSAIYGGIANMMLAQIFVIPLAVLVSLLFGESCKWWPQVLAAVIALLPIVGMFLLQRVISPIKVFDEQTKRLELKSYDDIEIDKFESPETIDEKRARKTYRNRRVTKLEFLVRNKGNISLLSTYIGMTDIKWHSEKYNNKPDDIETGFFKWADSDLEKVDIAPKGGYERMLLAIYDIDLSVSAFRFVFHNGTSQVPRTLIDGRYTIKIRVDGQAKKEKNLEDLDPIFFSVSFDFDSSGFQNIVVSKLPRE